MHPLPWRALHVVSLSILEDGLRGCGGVREVPEGRVAEMHVGCNGFRNAGSQCEVSEMCISIYASVAGSYGASPSRYARLFLSLWDYCLPCSWCVPLRLLPFSFWSLEK